MAEAAHRQWHRSNVDREPEVAGRQLRQQFAHAGLEPFDQFALHAALFGAAEDVEHATAQRLAPGQPAQRGQQPAAQLDLARRLAILAAADQRRRHVEAELHVALELLAQRLAERRVGVQARHLVLVLVRHQLAQRQRHGAGEGLAAGGHGLLARVRLAHQRGVAPGPGGVLVLGELAHGVGDKFIQRFAVRGCRLHRIAQQCRARARVGRGQTAEREGGLVGRHGDAVEFDGALDGSEADGHQPALPGVAHRNDVGRHRVAQKVLGQALRVEGFHALVAGGKAQLGQQAVGLQAGVGVLQRFGHRRLVDVGQDARAAVAHRAQRLGLRGHHGVAGQHGVGLLGVDAHLVQPLGYVGQAQEAHHRPALLRKAHEVEHAGALALQVRGHGDHGAHRHHAGAADAGDQQVVRAGPPVRRRLGQAGHQAREGVLPALADAAAGQRTGLLAQRAARHADEAGAKALDAGIVLVAGGLVDLALAAERRLVRQHGHAVALHAAVAAAFAHRLVDEQALGQVSQFALLAAPALFGGTGLLVDQHGDAVDLAQLALHAVELLAVEKFGAVRKARLLAVVLADVVGQHDDLLHTLALDLARDGIDADDAIDRLPARHRHRVVEQDLVGDARLRRHRLADGEVARVVIGAVAQVLEHMRLAREHGVRDPVHALAAHLDQPGRLAVHPVGHKVAADAGARAGALWHLGGGVVRAASAKVRQALDAVGLVAEQFGQREVAHQRTPVGKALRKVADQPVGRQLDQARRAQLTQAADERLAAGIALAQDDWPHRGVVEQVAQLRLDHRALFLDDQNLAQALRKRLHARGLDGERQAHLVQPHARIGQHLRRDIEPPQHFHQVVVRLAAGDDAHRGQRRLDNLAVDRVHSRKGRHRPQLVRQALLDL